ncbi:hypothetical protein L9F63_018370, partial [Diploptera punctata]
KDKDSKHAQTEIEDSFTLLCLPLTATNAASCSASKPPETDDGSTTSSTSIDASPLFSRKRKALENNCDTRESR